MLTTTVKLPGAAAYDSKMVIHTSTENIYTSLERLFQKHLSDPTRAHGLLGHVKYIKRASKRKWNNHEYASHIPVKISCATTQLPELSFYVPFANTHGVRGLSKHYHLQLDPNLVYVKCAIRKVTCAFLSCKTMLDNPWAYKVDPKK